VNDHGFLNPDYYAEVTLENNGDEDGTFTIYADFVNGGRKMKQVAVEK
jgi:hypothetical protein